MHQPKNGKPAPVLCIFCSRDMTDTRIRKSTKATITCLKKSRISNGTGCPFVCTHTCGSNTRLEFQIETRKKLSGESQLVTAVYSSNATCSHHYLFNVWKSFLGRISWWVTNWAVQPISIVFLSCLQHSLSIPIFTLVGNNDFRKSFIQILGEKSRQKLVILSLLGYLDGIESNSQTVWTCTYVHHCATVSASNFQLLFSSGRRASTPRSLIRFLAGPACSTAALISCCDVARALHLGQNTK